MIGYLIYSIGSDWGIVADDGDTSGPIGTEWHLMSKEEADRFVDIMSMIRYRERTYEWSKRGLEDDGR